MVTPPPPPPVPLRALCLPGCGSRGAFQFGALKRLWEQGERFDLVVGASSGSLAGAVLTAGLALDGPEMLRSMAKTPIFSHRYLKTERSPFGLGAIVRSALSRLVPEKAIIESSTELVVSTTRARKLLSSVLSSARDHVGARVGRRAPSTKLAKNYPFASPSLMHALAVASEALVLHSNRERHDMHNVIVASCTIPVLYAKLPVLDGEVHIDGGASDNTLLAYLLSRGACDITVVTPYGGGAVSPTLFERTQEPVLPHGVRFRSISPERPLRLRHFDFDPERMDEALSMPAVIREHTGPSEPEASEQ